MCKKLKGSHRKKCLKAHAKRQKKKGLGYAECIFAYKNRQGEKVLLKQVTTTGTWHIQNQKTLLEKNSHLRASETHLQEKNEGLIKNKIQQQIKKRGKESVPTKTVYNFLSQTFFPHSSQDYLFESKGKK